MTTQTTNQITEPEILTANTYFWSPQSNASGRRWNENRRQNEVDDFLTSLEFEVTREGDSVVGKKGDLEVHFHYRESCRNVYKSFSVHRGEKKSNITALRKLYK